MKGNNLKTLFLIVEAFLILNIILIPKLFVIYVFTGLFVYLIYRKFAENNREFLYHSTLLFSIMYLTLYMPIGSKYSIYYFYVSLFIYIVLFLTDVWKNRRKFFKADNFKNKYMIFFFTFAAYAVFSIALAADKHAAIKQVLVYAIMFCFLIMIVRENKSKTSLKKSFGLLGYIYAGIIFLGTLELFGRKYGLRTHFTDYKISFYTYSFAKRIPTVFFYNPNNYAILLVMAMAVLFAAYLYATDKKSKRNIIILYALSQLNLIFTTCRTAWISIMLVYVFGYAILLIARYKKFRIVTVKFALGTMVGFFLLSLIPFMAPYYGKFATILILLRRHWFSANQNVAPALFTIGEGGSVNNRVTIIYDVIQGIFFKKHFLGFGAGNTANYIQSVNNSAAGVVNIHSLLFEILGDFGIPICVFAAFTYVSLVFDLVKKIAIKGVINYKYYFMLSLVLFGFIFLSFAPSTVITFIPFWLMLGFAASLVLNK